MRNGFIYSFSGLALGGKNQWKQMGLSFMCKHTWSQGCCWSASALAVLEGSVPRARLPWMGRTCIDGIQGNAKWEKFLKPPTKPVLELALCVWGTERWFKKPKPHLEERHQFPLGRKSQARASLVSVYIAPIPSRAEVHICSCHEVRNSWVLCSPDRAQSVTLLPNTSSRAAEVFSVPQ